MPSSHEYMAYKYLRKRWYKFNTEVQIIPWRKFRADIFIRMCNRNIVIEIDWWYHRNIFSRIYDRKRDAIFLLHRYKVYRIDTRKNIDKELDKIIRTEYIKFLIRKSILYTALLFSLLLLRLMIIK